MKKTFRDRHSKITSGMYRRTCHGVYIAGIDKVERRRHLISIMLQAHHNGVYEKYNCLHMCITLHNNKDPMLNIK